MVTSGPLFYQNSCQLLHRCWKRKSASHSSLQNHLWCFIDIWARWLCWPGKMLKFILVLLKPRLNCYVCTYGGHIIILENDTTVKKKKIYIYMDYRMNLIIYNVLILNGSNSTIWGNDGASQIPRYSHPQHHIHLHLIMGYQTVKTVSSLGGSPYINLTYCLE